MLRGSAAYKRMPTDLQPIPHSIPILLDLWKPEGLLNEQTSWAVPERFNPFLDTFPFHHRGNERGMRVKEFFRFHQKLLWHLGQANTLNGTQTELQRAFREADCLSPDCHTRLVIAKAFLNPLLCMFVSVILNPKTCLFVLGLYKYLFFNVFTSSALTEVILLVRQCHLCSYTTWRLSWDVLGLHLSCKV